MNFPILIIMEVVFAGLLAATTTRFNLQVVGANLPDCDQKELATTVKQTTGFALIAGALSVQAGDNIFQCGWHSFQTALWVTLIMSVVLLWQSLPTIIASACDAIDAAAEDVAAKGTTLVASIKVASIREQFVAVVSAATQSISKTATPTTTTSTSAESETEESSLSLTLKSIPVAFLLSSTDTSEPSTRANQLKIWFFLRKLVSWPIASPSAEKPTADRRSGTVIGGWISQIFQAFNRPFQIRTPLTLKGENQDVQN